MHLYFPNRHHFEERRAFLNSFVPQAQRRICLYIAPVSRGWQGVGLDLAMLASRLDVFHFTVSCRAKFRQVPSIVTVFDIAALSRAPTLVQKEQNYLLEMVKAIQSAAGIIAISENTKAQLTHHLKRHDATVIPLGVNLEQFQRATVETIIALDLDFTHQVV